MNLLVTLDSNYVYPLCIMLRSLMLNNADSDFDLFIAHSSLTDHDFEEIKHSVDETRTVIHSILIADEVFAKAPLLKRISKETYYRLLLTDYLPENVHKILYIDPDTVINGSIESLYGTDLGCNVLAAGIHTYGLYEKFNLTRLGMDKNCHYINAGVMLINVDEWRRNTDSTAIFNFIEQNNRKLILGDQDVINILFQHKTLKIDERLYNLDEKTFRYFSLKFLHKEPINLKWVGENTIIIHFNGKHKPWHGKPYKGKLGAYFEKYKRTRFPG